MLKDTVRRRALAHGNPRNGVSYRCAGHAGPAARSGSSRGRPTADQPPEITAPRPSRSTQITVVLWKSAYMCPGNGSEQAARSTPLPFPSLPCCPANGPGSVPFLLPMPTWPRYLGWSRFYPCPRSRFRSCRRALDPQKRPGSCGGQTEGLWSGSFRGITVAGWKSLSLDLVAWLRPGWRRYRAAAQQPAGR